MDMVIESSREVTLRQLAEDMLIAAYVPEVEYLNHAEALDLALKRDLEAAAQLKSDITG